MLDKILVIDGASFAGVHFSEQSCRRSRRVVYAVPSQRRFESFQGNLVASSIGLAPKHLQARGNKNVKNVQRLSVEGRPITIYLESINRLLTSAHRFLSHSFKQCVRIANASLLIRKFSRPLLAYHSHSDRPICTIK